MRSGFKTGKIFGIQIRVDWSWLVIFFLVSWNLASALGNLHSNWSTALNWALAVTGALLFFLSVLAHELAHSVIAQSRGIPVNSIRLHLFGGVSDIQREPESPTGEFVMAILGPVTSLAIGGLLLLATGLLAGTSLSTAQSAQQILSKLSPVATVMVWLGSVNITLGIFNLIPGFPLDGGRVLRAILWGVTNNLRRATQMASWVGQAIAWLMIFAGIATVFGANLPLIGQGLGNGIWLAFIGWFLHNAAVQSYRQLVIRDALEDVPVSEVMRRNPPTVTAETTIADFVHNTLMQTDDQGFPVLDQGQLTGLVTLQDVREIPRDQWAAKRIRDIMTPAQDLVSVSPSDDASTALELLGKGDFRQLPVLDGDKLEGVVRRRDILKWLQLQSGMEVPS
ncbi:MAG: site-2 protease family protein [Anaerolineae bacterium]|nr:site-2 protease family protein [Anaerolineae bacterium]